MNFYAVIDKDYLEEIIIEMAHHSTAIEGVENMYGIELEESNHLTLE